MVTLLSLIQEVSMDRGDLDYPRTLPKPGLHDFTRLTQLAATLTEEQAELLTIGDFDERQTFLGQNPHLIPLDAALDEYYSMGCFQPSQQEN